MTKDIFEERETPSVVEVRVFRHGQLVHRELCESEDEAAEVVETWSEVDGTECEVEDLSTHHRFGDVLEPEPVTSADEGYPEAAETGERPI